MPTKYYRFLSFTAKNYFPHFPGILLSFFASISLREKNSCRAVPTPLSFYLLVDNYFTAAPIQYSYYNSIIFIL